MPELPEVELVASSLDRLVKKRRITAAELLRERLAPNIGPQEFARNLKNTTINFVRRRGKHILFDLDNGQTLVTHLRMSGRFLLLRRKKENPKFTHAVFHFEDDTRLIFQDQRHFGYMNISRTDCLEKLKEIAKLAPEPFSDAFSPKYLRDSALRSKRSVKEFLLDQSKVCGLGNIYASEALFLANIHPAKRADRLSRPKIATLHRMIVATLNEAIEAGSTLNVDPENIDGSYYNGSFESRWRVYDREDEPCPTCETTILRLKQGGRSSYYCPRCQKK
jgi:formamidopyrimidine-DNA glycosylase